MRDESASLFQIAHGYRLPGQNDGAALYLASIQMPDHTSGNPMPSYEYYKPTTLSDYSIHRGARHERGMCYRSSGAQAAAAASESCERPAHTARSIACNVGINLE